MPHYEYYSPELDKFIEIYQSMHGDHSSFIDNDGIIYKRIYNSPQLNTESSAKIDPYNKKDFVKATSKKGSVGDILDLSAELSERRAEKDGEDPVKRKYFDDYKEKIGKKHMEDRKKKIDTPNYTVEF